MIKLRYVNVPKGAKENSINEIADIQAFSNLDLLNQEVVSSKIATLERNYTLLDGTFEFKEDNSIVPYISLSQSDENGKFTNNLILTRLYNQKYSSPGITLYFDEYRDNYPTSVNIKWYNDDLLLDSKDYKIDNSSYYCQNNVTAYNNIVIEFNNMNIPCTYLKINNITDGIIKDFYKDELVGLSILEQISSTSEMLSINTLDFEVNNKSDVDIMFIRTMPLSLYKDDVLLGTFFIDKSEKDYNYKINAVDYIGLLEYETYLGGMYTNKLASEVIADILGDIPFELDSNLSEKVLNGYLAVQTKRQALQQIAFNLCAIIDCSRSDKIIIKAKTTESVGIIGSDRIISTKETVNAVTTQIQVTEHNYVVQENTTELYNGVVNGLITVLFGTPATNLTITNGTIVTSDVNYAIIQGTGKNVVLKGNSYQDTTQTVAKDNQLVSITDLANVKTYNSTLTTSANSSELLENLVFIQKYYDIQYKLGNEVVGDVVTIDNKNMRITSIDYDIDAPNLYGKAKLEVLS